MTQTHTNQSPIWLRSSTSVGHNQTQKFKREIINPGLLPRKLTCPLKINGWFRCISYWTGPFLGDEFVRFQGCIWKQKHLLQLHRPKWAPLKFCFVTSRRVLVEGVVWGCFFGRKYPSKERVHIPPKGKMIMDNHLQTDLGWVNVKFLGGWLVIKPNCNHFPKWVSQYRKNFETTTAI